MATLSQFSSLEGLLVLGQQVDIRPTLLRVLTDLYMQKAVHTHEEEVHYTELALRLIESVDEPTRQVVRTALHSYDAAPRVVLARLAATTPATAAAETKAADIKPAEPVAAPARTKALRLLAPPGTVELTEQFFTASPEERRAILLHLHYACPPRAPRGALTNAAAIIQRIETAVLQRNAEEASWQLERALEVGRPTARRIVDDETGEPFLVAAKVIGIPTHVLHRILLFLNPAIGRSVQRVYELAGLYNDIDSRTADWLLSIWRDGEIAALNEKTAGVRQEPSDSRDPRTPRPVAWPERSANREPRASASRVPRSPSPPRTPAAPAPTEESPARPAVNPHDARSLLAALDTRIRGQ